MEERKITTHQVRLSLSKIREIEITLQRRGRISSPTDAHQIY